MSVLAATMSQLTGYSALPVTSTSGGTSQGNPNAGSDASPYPKQKPVTVGDRVGASILTVVVIGAACSTFMWMGWGVSVND